MILPSKLFFWPVLWLLWIKNMKKQQLLMSHLKLDICFRLLSDCHSYADPTSESEWGRAECYWPADLERLTRTRSVMGMLPPPRPHLVTLCHYEIDVGNTTLPPVSWPGKALSLSVFSCFIVKIFCSILQTQSFTRIAECRNIGPFKLIRIDARQWCINEGAVWSEPTSLTYNKQFISISSNWMKFQSFEKTHTGIIGTYKKCH